MTKSLSIEEIKNLHNNIVREAAESGLEMADDTKTFFDSKKSEIDDLIENMENFSKKMFSFEDYQWLSQAAIQWQMIYSSTFNQPKSINVSAPPLGSLPTLSGQCAWTESEIDDWINMVASIRGRMRVRLLGRESTEEEMRMDWRYSQAMFASEVLNGRVNFARRISHTSYPLLEREWLKYVKCLRAYFNWERRNWKIDQTAISSDYDDACKHLRNMMVEKDIKASSSEFGEARAYIEKNFLTEKGKIARKRPSVMMAIARKAERIYGTTGSADNLRNWSLAEEYIEMFYENIIPAVLLQDDEAKHEKVLSVLKAFQFSKNPERRLLVINCFEAALAIYFLDRNIILKIWKGSENKDFPDFTFESEVKLSYGSREYSPPKTYKDKFIVDGRLIKFKGVMTKKQKAYLLRKCQPEHSHAIQTLFNDSRLVHKETTL